MRARYARVSSTGERVRRRNRSPASAMLSRVKSSATMARLRRRQEHGRRFYALEVEVIQLGQTVELGAKLGLDAREIAGVDGHPGQRRGDSAQEFSRNRSHGILHRDTKTGRVL